MTTEGAQIYLDLHPLKDVKSLLVLMVARLHRMQKRSLESGLVKIEWQNALVKASNCETRLVPVRIDNAASPEVLRQSLYIDTYSVGIKVGLNQIVSVIQGKSTFTPQHLDFYQPDIFARGRRRWVTLFGRESIPI
jgi:hypothetical protein